MTRKRLNEYSEKLGMTIGEALLTPTKIYVKFILALLEKFAVKGIAHITGGGFYENIPRMFGDGLRAKVDKDSFEILPIFELIQEKGGISEKDMFNTFNMGIGLVMAVSAQDAEAVVKEAETLGEKAWVIGEVTAGENGVDL